MLTRNYPIPEQHYGKGSPFHAITDNDDDMTFTPHTCDALVNILEVDLEQLHIFFQDGVIPSPVPDHWHRLHLYFDVPILEWVYNQTWADRGDEVLWLRKLTRHVHSGGCTWAAKNGFLRTLQWFREIDIDWTSDAADRAASNGHLATLRWVRENGGPWTFRAADRAAANGHLETLRWIRENGGDWTFWAADGAARNGHLETLQWIRNNGGDWTTWAADGAARNGHLETLQWIRNNGGDWANSS